MVPITCVLIKKVSQKTPWGLKQKELSSVKEKYLEQGKRRIFSFNGVPVVARTNFWSLPVLVTLVLAWVAGMRKRDRSWRKRLAIGFLEMPVAMFAEIGHAMAHSISAKAVGAPMDEILLSVGMPRTLYFDNDVPPETHIVRSLGGPIFSFFGFILSLFWRKISARGSFSRELAEVSLFGHSVIFFGSLAPYPVVDGGTVYKWKLVQVGKSVEQADQIVNIASFSMSCILVGFGVLVGLLNWQKIIQLFKGKEVG
jgi:hypothetical protein